MKNLLLATSEKRILFLSETVEGAHSEKKLADEAGLCFDAEPHETRQVVELLVDLGFVGYHAPGAALVRPHKKPRGGELAPQQKTENRERSRKRVVIEHAIGGVKIWRVVKDVFRSWLHAARDRVMYLACGLHNFRLRCRARPVQT